MTNFNDYLTQQMKDPAFKEAYEQLEPEFAIIQAIIDARKSAGITQKELSQNPVSHKEISANWKMEMPILQSKRCSDLQLHLERL